MEIRLLGRWIIFLCLLDAQWLCSLPVPPEAARSETDVESGWRRRGSVSQNPSGRGVFVCLWKSFQLGCWAPSEARPSGAGETLCMCLRASDLVADMFLCFVIDEETNPNIQTPRASPPTCSRRRSRSSSPPPPTCLFQQFILHSCGYFEILFMFY